MRLKKALKKVKKIAIICWWFQPLRSCTFLFMICDLPEVALHLPWKDPECPRREVRLETSSNLDGAGGW